MLLRYLSEKTFALLSLGRKWGGGGGVTQSENSDNDLHPPPGKQHPQGKNSR